MILCKVSKNPSDADRATVDDRSASAGVVVKRRHATGGGRGVIPAAAR